MILIPSVMVGVTGRSYDDAPSLVVSGIEGHPNSGTGPNSFMY
jgi:hypothetical protein